MHLAAAVLFLGCAAIDSKVAMRSDLIADNGPYFVEHPDIHRVLARFGLDFSLPAPGAVETQAIEPGKRALIRIRREEAIQLIHLSAARHQVPASFVKSIVAAESNFDSAVVSPKGAIGLMQLMPQTAEEYGADPNIPEQNVDAGTRYLRVLMNRYRNYRDSLKRVIAAYNAGPGNVDRYRGVPPFRETKDYVVRVMNYLRQFEGLRKRAPITLAAIMKN